MKRFGLIGKKLSHSFSKKYFTEKFVNLGLDDHEYHLFEIPEIVQIKEILTLPDLVGLNVTVPYKEEVIPFLTKIDDNAEKVGAVNVIKKAGEEIIGFNSDFFGFRTSLINWLPKNVNLKALVFGTGGASKAVVAVLQNLGIDYKLVSREPADAEIGYSKIDQQLLAQYSVIINTTPLGMAPEIDTFPDFPYQYLNSKHFLYDLVYNPTETVFLQKGKQQGAQIKNGLEMLHLQAEESWEIWNS